LIADFEIYCQRTINSGCGNQEKMLMGWSKFAAFKDEDGNEFGFKG
jgi:hypothetical protein